MWASLVSDSLGRNRRGLLLKRCLSCSNSNLNHGDTGDTKEQVYLPVTSVTVVQITDKPKLAIEARCGKKRKQPDCFLTKQLVVKNLCWQVKIDGFVTAGLHNGSASLTQVDYFT